MSFQHTFTSRFAKVVLDNVLGPPQLVGHRRQGPCFFVVPEAMHEASRWPLNGDALSAQKAFSGDEGVAGRNARAKYFFDEGSLNYPPSK